MVNVQQLILSLPWLSGQSTLQNGYEFTHAPSAVDSVTQHKSIAIVGAGSSGLSSLKTFLDVAESTGQDWEVVVFEKREDVGGVWLHENVKPEPPRIPESPVHSQLRINIPHPYMTYMNHPFPENTSLLAKHDALGRYHTEFVSHHNLSSYINLNHNVAAASWVGNSTNGVWNLTYNSPLESGSETQMTSKLFDHLVVATGTDHYPRTITWPGLDEWLAATGTDGSRHEILHSIYWESPDPYINKTVVVVGGAAGGADIMINAAPVAQKLYWSVKNETSFLVKNIISRLPSSFELRPVISHFTANTIFFTDGSNCSNVDAVIMATGYEKRIPFLEETGILHVIPTAHSNDTYDLGLVTNLRYYSPLHKHMLPIIPQLPSNALAIIGIIENGLRFRISVAQSLYFAHSIINANIIPSREDMYREIYLREERYKEKGYNPYLKGHFLFDGVGEPPASGIIGYMDYLVEYLKDRGAIPNDGKKFTPAWMLKGTPYFLKAINNWMDIIDMGEEEELKWLKGVRTEEEWADLMYRVAIWERD